MEIGIICLTLTEPLFAPNHVFFYEADRDEYNEMAVDLPGGIELTNIPEGAEIKMALMDKSEPDHPHPLVSNRVFFIGRVYGGRLLVSIPKEDLIGMELVVGMDFKGYYQLMFRIPDLDTSIVRHEMQTLKKY